MNAGHLMSPHKTSDPYTNISLQDKQAKNAHVPHALINYTVQCLYKTGL